MSLLNLKLPHTCYYIGHIVVTLGVALCAGRWYHTYLEDHKSKIALSKRLKESVEKLYDSMDHEDPKIDSESLNSQFEYTIYNLKGQDVKPSERQYFERIKDTSDRLSFEILEKGGRRVHLSYTKHVGAEYLIVGEWYANTEYAR